MTHTCKQRPLCVSRRGCQRKTVWRGGPSRRAALRVTIGWPGFDGRDTSPQQTHPCQAAHLCQCHSAPRWNGAPLFAVPSSEALSSPERATVSPPGGPGRRRTDRILLYTARLSTHCCCLAVPPRWVQKGSPRTLQQMAGPSELQRRGHPSFV